MQIKVKPPAGGNKHFASTLCCANTDRNPNTDTNTDINTDINTARRRVTSISTQHSSVQIQTQTHTEIQIQIQMQIQTQIHIHIEILIQPSAGGNKHFGSKLY